MIRYAVLAFGLSYTALWFVQTLGAPARIAALVLLGAGLALAIVDIVTPRSWLPDHTHPRDEGDRDDDDDDDDDDEDDEDDRDEDDRDEDDEPVLVLSPRRVRPYIDPATTGPIPVVAAHRADRS